MGRPFTKAGVRLSVCIELKRVLRQCLERMYCDSQKGCCTRCSPISSSQRVYAELSSSSLYSHAVHRFRVPVSFVNNTPSWRCWNTARLWSRQGSGLSLRMGYCRGVEGRSEHRPESQKEVSVLFETNIGLPAATSAVNWRSAYPDGFGKPGAYILEPSAPLSRLALRFCRNRQGPILAANIFCRMLDGLPKHCELWGSEDNCLAVVDQRRLNSRKRYKTKCDTVGQGQADIQGQLR